MADESEKDEASDQRRQKLVKAGVAALLYASKVKKKPRR